MKFKLALIVAIIYTAIVYFAHFVFKYDILNFNWIFIFPIILMAYYDFNAGIYYSIAVNFTKLSFVADSYSKGEKYTTNGIEGMIFLIVIAYISGIFFEKSREKDSKLLTYSELIKIASEKENRDKFYAGILDYTVKKFSGESAFIILISKEGFLKDMYSNTNENIDFNIIDKALEDKNSLISRIFLNGEKQRSNFASIDFRYENNSQNISPKFMAVPIEADGKKIGIISIESKDNYRNFTTDDLEYFSEYASIVGLIIENLEYYKRGLYDELLDIPGERYIKKKVESILIEKTQTNESSVFYSIVMIDIDNFKKINEIYSSLNGDSILRQSVEIIKSIVGKNDFMGRISGNCFILIFANKGKYITKDIIEELRINYMTHDFTMKERKIKMTFSASIVSVPLDNVNSYEEIKELLEKRLYRAKMTGKNYIVEY